MELSKNTMKKLVFLVVLGGSVLTAPQWFDKAVKLLGLFNGILSPFIAGAAMAFILNVPMRFIERRLLLAHLSEKQVSAHHSLIRAVSLLLTLIFVVLVLLVLGFVVFPQLARTISGLGATIQAALTRFLQWEQLQFADHPGILAWLEELTIDWQSIDWRSALTSVIDFLKNGAGNVLSSTINAAKGVVSTVASLAIALVFAIYILLQKEKLGVQFRKAAYALLPRRAADYAVKVCSLSHRVFSSFITGQCTEAVILGSMFFVSMLLLRMPYALLVGCLIAVTALIPIVGAFIGCFVGAFLILMVSPIKALAFVILFLILQQVEGNLIYPHVVGSSVGLPSIWVLAAVSVGGSLMGITGMLIFIPLLSVCYTLFRDFVHRRLRERNIAVV